MASRHANPIPERRWALWLVPCVPITLVIGSGSAALGGSWRATLSANPTDPLPGTGLFVLGIGAALGMLLGLALVVSEQRPVGVWVLLASVALIVGATVAFAIGP